MTILGGPGVSSEPHAMDVHLMLQTPVSVSLVLIISFHTKDEGMMCSANESLLQQTDWWFSFNQKFND